MLRLAAADAAASVNWTACLRLASAAVPRVRRSHLRERAVSTVAFARAQPQDGVPTTTTRVRSLGTPIVHAGVFRCVTVTVAETTVRRLETTTVAAVTSTTTKRCRRQQRWKWTLEGEKSPGYQTALQCTNTHKHNKDAYAHTHNKQYSDTHTHKRARGRREKHTARCAHKHKRMRTTGESRKH